MKFIRLTDQFAKNGSKRTRLGVFWCSCCKKQTIKLPSNGRRSKSCGCRKHNWIHGLSRTNLYQVWNGMIQRCHRNSAQSFQGYGARGITVCRKWHDFKAFQEWAASHGYRPGLQIDRKDNERGYHPENCRFVTAMVNSQNTRRCKITLLQAQNAKALLAQGLGPSEIARRMGTSRGVIDHIKRGRTWRNA